MINDEQVETVYRRLSEAMPGRTKDAKGPKGQPDAFRSCISCMLSAQSLDRNTAKAARALFELAQTPETCWHWMTAILPQRLNRAGSII